MSERKPTLSKRLSGARARLVALLEAHFSVAAHPGLLALVDEFEAAVREDEHFVAGACVAGVYERHEIELVDAHGLPTVTPAFVDKRTGDEMLGDDKAEMKREAAALHNVSDKGIDGYAAEYEVDFARSEVEVTHIAVVEPAAADPGAQIAPPSRPAPVAPKGRTSKRG